jgi:amidase
VSRPKLTRDQRPGPPTASFLVDAVARGDVSARQLAEEHLARIEARNPEVNAVVVLDAERALADADAVDGARARGQAVGPLAGVPMTVKEAFDVAGLATTAGMPDYQGQRARCDAPAVAVLRRAGAIILGKTNVPTQLADLQCANPLFGSTSNPWDTDRSSGGSSGGSAAALAAGLSALELGSDLSGSIRVPSSWCGVYGLRPSYGLISKRGHMPWPTGGLLEPPVSVVGPLARCVEDLALAFDTLVEAGPRSAGESAARARWPSVRAQPENLRVAVWTTVTEAPIDTETATVLDAARAALEGAGCTVEDLIPPVPAGPALDLAWRLVDAEITHGLTADQWDEVRAGPESRLVQSVRDHLADQEAALEVARAWEAALGPFDALLCPATPVVAQPHDTTPPALRPLVIDGAVYAHDVLAHWSLLTSVAQLPAVTLPVGVGTRSRLPVGAQLVGRSRHDRELLAVAATVDDIVSGYATPPGW